MRKIISLVLIAALTITTGISAFAAPTVPGTVYSDQQASGINKPVVQIQQELLQAGIKDVQPTDWFAGAITIIVQAGLLAPKQDGSFQPEAILSSGEGIAVFAKVLGIAAKNDTPELALAKAQEAGIVNSKVTADSDLSRLEVAKLLALALGVESQPIISSSLYPFADFDKLSPEDRGMMKALFDLGLFKGFPEEGSAPTFRPESILTRAQIAIMVDRLLGVH